MSPASAASQTLPAITLPEVPTRRTLRVCALFGLGVEVGRGDDGGQRAARGAAELCAHLAPGRVALVTGPSGSGKSRMVRVLVASIARDPGAVCVRPRPIRASLCQPGASAVDAIKGDLTRSLGVLAAAGLADARVLTTPAELLSDGQQQRLSLAIAIDRAERLLALGRRVVLAADEFAMSLDAHTAQSVARAAGRWARRSGSALVVAAAREDLLGHLDPDVVATCAPEGSVGFTTRANAS